MQIIRLIAGTRSSMRIQTISRLWDRRFGILFIHTQAAITKSATMRWLTVGCSFEDIMGRFAMICEKKALLPSAPARPETSVFRARLWRIKTLRAVRNRSMIFRFTISAVERYRIRKGYKNADPLRQAFTLSSNKTAFQAENLSVRQSWNSHHLYRTPRIRAISSSAIE
jgi:hypothetical protein